MKLTRMTYVKPDCDWWQYGDDDDDDDNNDDDDDNDHYDNVILAVNIFYRNDHVDYHQFTSQYIIYE